jgi:hypothetical protein
MTLLAKKKECFLEGHDVAVGEVFAALSNASLKVRIGHYFQRLNHAVIVFGAQEDGRAMSVPRNFYALVS